MSQQAANQPLNRYSLWRYLLIIFILVIGVIYALPNLYGEDPSIQVSPQRDAKLGSELEQSIENVLNESSIELKRMERDDKAIIIRFPDTESQLSAQYAIDKAIRDAYGNDAYTVAMNLAPATPDWLRDLSAAPMKLGLDLRGGIHFLMEVDMNTALKKRENQYVSDFKSALRKEKLHYLRPVERSPAGGVMVKFREEEIRDKAYEYLRSQYQDLTFTKVETGNQYALRGYFGIQQLRTVRDDAVRQNITTLRNRVNQLGVAEPLIQRQGAERIVVQLPGVQDSAKAKEILSATASLEFRMLNETRSVDDALRGRVPRDSEILYERNGRPQLLKKDVIVTGDHIVNANSGMDENGFPQVNIVLDGKGGSKMSASSKRNIKKMMATVFIEYKTDYIEEDGKLIAQPPRKVEEVINVARIQTTLGNRFRITGIDSASEAHNLALLLRAGALTAPIQIVEERTIGPSLGQENIDLGMLSIQIGMGMVLIFMLVYYKLFGLVANVALVTNLVLIVAVMSLIPGATLTLPGIAGIVLTVGMAVDANVLIFERIREELRSGASPQKAIHNGYDKALSTIADANITTLVAAIILFAVGTGPIKGFAVTLSIGILTSMFTAIMGSRAIINLVYGGKNVKTLSI
ncbi:MAG: protein translocase subunit SecD [Gammaproteobacteria bacterium]|nr:protein translocase subunit SecD [Gammaproteobacteria bacterium]